MALNPAYNQQSTRALPFCLGWVYVTGDKVNSIFGLDIIPPAIAATLPSNAVQIPAEVEVYILAEGEWDSIYMFIPTSSERLLITDSLVGGIPVTSGKFPNQITVANRLEYVHFHRGSYATVGLPNNLVSYGPDQGTDGWLNYMPTITPALAFSGKAYYFLRAGANTDGSAPTLSPSGVFRSTRCRTFDASGNVTNYGFTTNPTWQMVETLLRYQIKPQQPGISGLTVAERACFDWPAIVAHAERNATILANGRPRFTGNFAFAAETSVGSMMETQLRNCVSFRRQRGSKISFVGEEERGSVFTFSKRNMLPDSLKLGKKDLQNVPNVYVPQYRDLGVPAISQVQKAVTSVPAGGGTAYTTMFTTVSAQPFGPADCFVYGGSSDDADFAGPYSAGGSTTTLNGVVYEIIYDVANQVPAFGGPQKSATATGGYLGTEQSRFANRAPEVVQHRSAQKLMGQVSPGVSDVPKQIRVFYDLGNNTFDQTNRVMNFMMNRDLGTDGPNWLAPFVGSISGWLEAVDANGNALLEVEPGDVITIDSTASPEFGMGSAFNPSGLYEVVDPLQTSFPAAQDATNAKRTLSLQTYNPNAYSDVSQAPGASYQTVPGNDLPMADVMPANTPFWLLQATPSASFDGSTGSITIPDITILWLGQTSPTVYPSVTLSGIPVGHTVTVYLNVVNQATNPTLTLDTTSLLPGYPTAASSSGPPTPLPYGKIVIFYGSFTDASTFNSASSSTGGYNADASQGLAVSSGASTGLVFTAEGGFSGPAVTLE